MNVRTIGTNRASTIARAPYFAKKAARKSAETGDAVSGPAPAGAGAAADFGLGRVEVNRGLMAVLVGMSLFAPLLGRALDRYSGRLVVMTGAVLVPAGWVGIASSTNVTAALEALYAVQSDYMDGLALGDSDLPGV